MNSCPEYWRQEFFIYKSSTCIFSDVFLYNEIMEDNLLLEGTS